MALKLWKCKPVFNLNSLIQNAAPQILLKTSAIICYRKYCVSVSTNQEYDFIEFLNSSCPEVLKKHDFSPLFVQKIINAREIKNLTVEDLPMIGIGRKERFLIRQKLDFEDQSVDIMKLQSLIGNQSSMAGNDLDPISLSTIFQTNENKKFENSSKRKKNIFYFTFPNIKDYHLKDVDSITAISITHSHMGVTTIKVDEKIEDMKVIPLFIDSNTNEPDIKNFKYHEIYEKVLLATQHIPKSDLLIFEKLSAAPGLGRSQPKNLQMMKSMLLALTNTWRDEDDFHSTIFVQKSIVSKLYKLEVGSERISCIETGEKILRGERPLAWLPQLTFSESPLRRYILSTQTEKINMIESLLLAIAFNSIYIKKRFGNFF